MDSPAEILLNPEADENAWKTAVGLLLLDVKENLKEVKHEVREVKDKHANCGIEKLTKIIFGNGNPKEGLITKHEVLQREVSIRGSLWGVIGGSGMTAILALVYVLLRGHL